MRRRSRPPFCPAIARALDFAIESLERRQLLSVSLDANGWTVVGESADTRKIYVSSSSGSDSNSGLSSGSPVKTLAKAKSLVRNNMPDWILLKKGDTWVNETFGSWTTSGRSLQEPQLISSYGTGARPKVDTWLNYGLEVVGGMITPVNYVSVIGLEFVISGYNGVNKKGVQALRFQRQGQGFLVEDVKTTGFSGGIVIGNSDAPVSNFKVRRCVVADAFQYNGHAQGLYVSGTCSNILIEENVFDHNGWINPQDKNVFNHNMYINTGATGVVIKGNIITRGSLRGTLLRSGGTVLDNFYAQNSVAVQVGNTSSTVNNNVILEGVDLKGVPSGVGIDVAFSVNGFEAKNNIIAHDWSGYTYNLSGINLNGGTRNAVVEDNVMYSWRRGVINQGTSNINIRDNEIQDFDNYHALIEQRGTVGNYSGSTYYSNRSAPFKEGTTYKSWSSWQSSTGDTSTYGTVRYVDPNRDAGTYNATLGGPATFDAWIASVRNRSKDNWNTALTAYAINDYIRAGFAHAPASSGPLVSVLSTTKQTDEGSSTPGVFKFTRTGSTASSLTVNYRLTGTAINGTDYTTLPLSVTFDAGQSTKTINVSAINDGVGELVEVVEVRLVDGANYDLDASAAAVVRIIDVNGGLGDVVIPPGSGDPPGGGDEGDPPPDPGEDDIINDTNGGDGGAYDTTPTGTGLRGEYFDNADLTGFVFQRVDDLIEFDWGTDAPDAGMGADTFSVRWTGKIQPQYSENYTFYLLADDGVRMWVNGEKIIDSWSVGTNVADITGDGSVDSLDFNAFIAGYGITDGATRSQGDLDGDGAVNTYDFNILAGHWGEGVTTPSLTEYTGTYSLERGTLADVVIEYFESTGHAQAELYWSSASRTKQLIPLNRMYPAAPLPSAPLSAAADPPDTESFSLVPASPFADAPIVEEDELLLDAAPA